VTYGQAIAGSRPPLEGGKSKIAKKGEQSASGLKKKPGLNLEKIRKTITIYHGHTYMKKAKKRVLLGPF